MGKLIHRRNGHRPEPLEFTPDPLTTLYDNEVFVFGSNTAGRHGKGAALVAEELGAKYGENFGYMGGDSRGGRAYGIPTVDAKPTGPFKGRRMHLNEIQPYVTMFLATCRNSVTRDDGRVFILTKIGCGLAGHTIPDICSLFPKGDALPKNIVLPREFAAILRP